MNAQNITTITPASISKDFTVNPDTGDAYVSQRKAAELLGIHHSSIQKWLSTCHPDADVSVGLSDILLQEATTHYAMYSKSDNDKAKAFHIWLSKDGNSIRNCHEFHYSSGEKQKKRLNGYVYLFKIHDWYKIGKAKNVTSRLNGCQTGSPYEIEVIHTIPCADYNKSESSLHAKYDEVRGVGEWFKLTGEQVTEITNIKKL